MGASAIYVSILATEGPWAGKEFRLYHISHIDTSLKVGDKVTQGQYIGTLCSQGQSSGPHIHLEVATSGIYGNSCDPVGDWFSSLFLHESISSIELENKSFTPDLKIDGFTTDDIENLNSKTRFNSKIIIPDEFKK